MRKVLFVMSLPFWLGMFSACDKSNDVERQPSAINPSDKRTADTISESVIVNGDSTTTDQSGNEVVVKYSHNCSKMRVIFQLQNEEGMECYVFNEGDNIIFRLEIHNDIDENVIVPPLSEIIGFDAFSVYSQEGQKIGTPWDEIVTTCLGGFIIGADSSAVFVCPWYDIPALYFFGYEHYYSEYFF